jgi:predicted permease
MIFELLPIFVNVLVPVFALVLLGYIVGPRLELHPRTLSRYGLYILTPAFIFDVLSKTTIRAELALRMTLYIIVVHVLCALVGFGVAKLLRRPPQMVAVYVLIAVFGNVGNFGLPIISFALGEEALPAATIYFLAIMVIAFIVGIGAANWNSGSRLQALFTILKTPALLAVPPALLLNGLNIDLPPIVARPVTLLAGALIPTMLVMLGAQLAQAGISRLDKDMVIASSIRLAGAPLVALLLAAPMGIVGVERGAGILQASMPIAVLTSVIAVEHNLMPDFVTSAVLFSTLASVVSLTLVVALVM